MAPSTKKNVLHDFSPVIIQYKDGRVKRLIDEESVPASLDPETGVQSKDVVISPEINLSARLYLPKDADQANKLPVLIYFHGGFFAVESAFSPIYQNLLNSLVAEANVVAVSVNYRLAPEHPLPAAYDDAWLTLQWIASHCGPEEEWIKDFADLDRVYMGGDSAGGNIAHNMAIRVGLENVEGIHLRGIFLNCPLFWGKDPVGNEVELGFHPSKFNDDFWRFVCPGTCGSDDPRLNPAMDPNLSRLGCERVRVYVAEKDFYTERGRFYKEALCKSGWEGDVEVQGDEEEEDDPIFGMYFPDNDDESGSSLTKRIAAFLNDEEY